jgi:putative hydrolase of the HAD superfamily
MKRYKAVLFDLYDTLAYVDRTSYEEKLNACAEICNVTPEAFSKVWKSLIVDSNLGRFPSTEDRVREAIRMLGLAEDQAVIRAVAKYEHAFLRNGTRLFPDTENTLLTLRRAGLRLGLVTNASPSVQVVLETHRISDYMDCTVVSSDVGYRKPDPHIYKVATDKLGMEAPDCVFIGDGNDGELDGAHDIGMTTVMVRRDLPKYVQTKESSMSSVDFVVRSLTELVQRFAAESARTNSTNPCEPR